MGRFQIFFLTAMIAIIVTVVFAEDLQSQVLSDPMNPDVHQKFGDFLLQQPEVHLRRIGEQHVQLAQTLRSHSSSKSSSNLSFSPKLVEGCLEFSKANENIHLQCEYGLHLVGLRVDTSNDATCAKDFQTNPTRGCQAVLSCLGKRECSVPVAECGNDVERVVIKAKCRGIEGIRCQNAMKELLPVLQEINNFYLWESHGVHVSPVNFYQPVPEVASLPASLWEKPAPMPGIDWSDERFMQVLDLCGPYKQELQQLPLRQQNDDPSTSSLHYHHANLYFSNYDAALYYCMLRVAKPKRVIEVGAGWSTLLASHALAHNAQENPDNKATLIAIDPNPMPGLVTHPGVTQVIASDVQSVGVELFLSLSDQDVLFIDGSHVVHLASDVRFMFLEVLPQLAPGVLVHVHDIFLPYHYPQFWLRNRLYFWNEQYFLQAFLTHNRDWTVLAPGHYLHSVFPEELAEKLGFVVAREQLTSSFWMQRIQ